MIEAKEAHRLSQEQRERRERERLDAQLDRVQRAIMAAVKLGHWSCTWPLPEVETFQDTVKAVRDAGYTVSDAPRNPNKYKRQVSWGSPKEPTR